MWRRISIGGGENRKHQRNKISGASGMAAINNSIAQQQQQQQWRHGMAAAHQHHGAAYGGGESSNIEEMAASGGVGREISISSVIKRMAAWQINIGSVA